MLLTGDIGGTKTRLALAEVNGNRVQIRREQNFASQQYAALEDMLEIFLHDQARVAAAAFAIAGPVRGDVAQTTNLPWRIDAAVLRQRFGFIRCRLLNDLEATAWGIATLGDADLFTLQSGAQDAVGNQAVIAAGTGLGEAGLYWDGVRHHPFATEGGHATFAPRDARELALLHFMQSQYEHVSWERVLSGMGLRDLYDFMCVHLGATTPPWLANEIAAGDKAAVISAAALAGKDEVCVETLRLFVQLYGAEAGNLALKMMSRGGLFIGGGIAPKILPLLQDGTFIDAFLAKGRMRPLLAAMPIKVILNDRAALYGPALFAARLET